jgi:BirA family biotin operon repressor/biotin-[acetyl-CoA-carboxylase] ligase
MMRVSGSEVARLSGQWSHAMITADVLSVEAIRQRLSASVVARQLYVLGVVESTNAVLRRLAREGAVEGTVVVADAQTAGRGRLGQPWFSPAGVNLYASVLFRPHFHPREAARFSLITSLALADAIEELSLAPAIKWPNDVLVGGRKVAGALVECPTRGERIDFLVLGVGVNVNVEQSALQAALGPAAAAATSLREAAGHRLDRNVLAAAYLSRLDAWARRYQAEGAEPILTAWRERDVLTGRRIEIRSSRSTVQGRALGVDGHGQLVLENSGGRRHAVLTEEIRIIEQAAPPERNPR